jgi:hypothetical protein
VFNYQNSCQFADRLSQSFLTIIFASLWLTGYYIEKRLKGSTKIEVEKRSKSRPAKQYQGLVFRFIKTHTYLIDKNDKCQKY